MTTGITELTFAGRSSRGRCPTAAYGGRATGEPLIENLSVAAAARARRLSPALAAPSSARAPADSAALIRKTRMLNTLNARRVVPVVSCLE